MPQPLTATERRILRAYQRSQRMSERAQAIYAAAGRAEQQLARKIFALKSARVLDPHTKAIRMTEEGRSILVTDQYSKAVAEAEQTGEAKVWAHAAARQFKLSEKNLD